MLRGIAVALLGDTVCYFRLHDLKLEVIEVFITYKSQKYLGLGGMFHYFMEGALIFLYVTLVKYKIHDVFRYSIFLTLTSVHRNRGY